MLSSRPSELSLVSCHPITSDLPLYFKRPQVSGYEFLNGFKATMVAPDARCMTASAMERS
jgi:hypothetical protein